MATTSKKAAAQPKAAKAPKTRGTGQRDRLSCRIDPKIKQRAEEAASILGQDLTAFTESALNEKAQIVLQQEERLMLSERDFERFLEAIENPSPPNAKLKVAAERYKATRKQHPELNW